MQTTRRADRKHVGEILAAVICALGVTMSACGGTDEPSSSDAAPTATSSKGGGDFTGEPVQLTADPCTLVTRTEAEAVIGAVNDTPGVGTDNRT